MKVASSWEAPDCVSAHFGGTQQSAQRAAFRSASSKLASSALAYFEPEGNVRTLHFTNGDFYEGETLADLRHGKGQHICSNGDTHGGNWYKGMRHGHGLATFARGFVYEGNFEYDHASGPGKARYENGSVYEGEFENDQRSGWGIQCFPDESLYVGEWSGDLMSGKGRLTMKDGSFFEGDWKAGGRVKGRWVSADRKQEYLGDWKGSVRHGHGTLHVEGLLQYTGEWQDDLQHGRGKCRWVDGSAYDGTWKEGERHGQGVLARADGYKYDGQWMADKESGIGNARLADKSRYTGDFLGGKPHGKGRMQTMDGERHEGLFVEGKRHGEGRCIFANGDRYMGGWAHDKRHGEGACQFADGTLFRGAWQDDQWVQTEAEPSFSRVAGPGLVKAVAGQDASFTILAVDELLNRRLVGGDSFMVWLEGPTTVHATVADNEDGTYTATYNTTTSGIYDVYITNDTGESVAESPYPLRILADRPVARRSTVRLLSSAKPALVGSAAAFKVEARDQFDNRCKIAELPEEFAIECELLVGGKPCQVDVEPLKGGCYKCSFTPTAAGFFRLNVTSCGTPLYNSPVSIRVDAADKDCRSFTSDQQLIDKVMEWERKAAQQYAADGDAEGWSSDVSEEQTAEQRYIREHPDVPVVENLGDMWKVTKLQRERKARKEAELAELELKEQRAAEQGSKEPHGQLEEESASSQQAEGVSALSAKMAQSSVDSPADDSMRSSSTRHPAGHLDTAAAQ